MSDTSIFVRSSDAGRQFLVYSMKFAPADMNGVAMVLPLPVPPRPEEDAVRFISLESCPDFFIAMKRGFPERGMLARPEYAMSGTSAVRFRTLEVHPVGGFEASFVPTMDDFGRLDPRFRMPPDVWAQVPQYADYGFAVFKLKSDGRHVAVHPMAFEFPRRDPGVLFVPTVHIHDGRYHPSAHFDHDIYCQTGTAANEQFDTGFEASSGPAASFMEPVCTDGIVDGGSPCFRQTLRGTYRNVDVFIRRGAYGRAGLRLEGAAGQIGWPGGISEFLDLIFAEISLNHSDEIDDCRRSHPELDTRYQTGDAYEQSLERAKKDLRTRLASDIALAREIYARGVPKGLMNAGAHFDGALDSTLKRALEGQRW